MRIIIINILQPFLVKIKCGVRDLNPRPSAWEADVVPGWTNSANPNLKPNII